MAAPGELGKMGESVFRQLRAVPTEPSEPVRSPGWRDPMAPARSTAPPWTCLAGVKRSKSYRARMSLASLIQAVTEWDRTRARRTLSN